ncbi:MAG: serine/threonine protein kinase [Verrucomicrobiae bacterium]|nr:serine/threonine protein kinase [Verrucomicrobiae bacterium]
MTESNPNQICPDCGATMPDDSPQDLCPKCLLRQALESRTLVDDGSPSAPSTQPPSPHEIADKFPGFEITECLGRGGMGVVYKARQKSLGRWVTIKILAPERVGDARFSERFAEEAQILARLAHPNIVTVFDYGETDGLYYIVMEFVDGVNLRDLLRDGKLDPTQALGIVPPICEALQFAHDKGIVHRDIKPENLLLDRDGRIKIADFGIASLVGVNGDPAGTPPYMAPEQGTRSQATDHRADIYALGVVLYEALTGERPGESFQLPSQKVHVDVSIDDIVIRALNRDPERRYHTADEFRKVIEKATAAQTRGDVDADASPAPVKPNAPLVPNPAPLDPIVFRIAGFLMIAIGIIQVLAVSVNVGNFIYFLSGAENGFFAEFLSMTEPAFIWFSAKWLISASLAVITIVGGTHLLKGKSRKWALAGAIACCLSTWGLVIGVVALVVLLSNTSEVFDPIGNTPHNQRRISRLAIAATGFHVLLLLCLAAGIFVVQSRYPITAGKAPSVFLIAFPVLFSAATGSILGWRAAIQIRKSEGKLYGKRLAVVTGMVVPSLLVIPLVAIGAGSLKELFASSPQFDDATALIVGTTTVSSIGAIAFLGLRTCFRYLAGKPLQCYSKRILSVAGILVGLWIVSGTLLWV